MAVYVYQNQPTPSHSLLGCRYTHKPHLVFSIRGRPVNKSAYIKWKLLRNSKHITIRDCMYRTLNAGAIRSCIK